MTHWGVVALNHGHSIAVDLGDRVVWRQGREDQLQAETVDWAQSWGPPQSITWYEDHWLKRLRNLRAGQWSAAVDPQTWPRLHLRRLGVVSKLTCQTHHRSHALTAWAQAPWSRAMIMVADAIGEFQTLSIWHAEPQGLRAVWSRSYPTSLGLFYSAQTRVLGLTPLRDESVLEQWSREGDPERFRSEIQQFWLPDLRARWNLHRGAEPWAPKLTTDQDLRDWAAATQWQFQELMDQALAQGRRLIPQDPLIVTGGCAMNGTWLASLEEDYYRPPQPMDPASSIGAALKHNPRQITVEEQ